MGQVKPGADFCCGFLNCGIPTCVIDPHTKLLRTFVLLNEQVTSHVCIAAQVCSVAS